MTEFAYNNVKNSSINQILFKFNYEYNQKILYKDDVDFCFQSKTAVEQSAELEKLIIVCQLKICYVQEFQIRAHDKKISQKAMRMERKFA